MKPIVKRTMIVAAVLVIGAAGLAFAHGPYGYGGYGMGPGMMGGYGGYGMGPGMMNGYGGYGMGPGMMGGYGGYGMGPGMMGGYYGMGPGMMWGNRGYGPGGNGYGDLPKEQAEKIEQARDKFFDETRTLRNQIGDKRYELNRELDKDQPDSAKAAKLQKEISQLQAEFDQKALQYQMEVRKLLPEGYWDRGSGARERW